MLRILCRLILSGLIIYFAGHSLNTWLQEHPTTKLITALKKTLNRPELRHLKDISILGSEPRTPYINQVLNRLYHTPVRDHYTQNTKGVKQLIYETVPLTPYQILWLQNHEVSQKQLQLKQYETIYRDNQHLLVLANRKSVKTLEEHFRDILNDKHLLSKTSTIPIIANHPYSDIQDQLAKYSSMSHPYERCKGKLYHYLESPEAPEQPTLLWGRFAEDANYLQKHYPKIAQNTAKKGFTLLYRDMYDLLILAQPTE